MRELKSFSWTRDRRCSLFKLSILTRVSRRVQRSTLTAMPRVCPGKYHWHQDQGVNRVIGIRTGRSRPLVSASNCDFRNVSNLLELSRYWPWDLRMYTSTSRLLFTYLVRHCFTTISAPSKIINQYPTLPHSVFIYPVDTRIISWSPYIPAKPFNMLMINDQLSFGTLTSNMANSLVSIQQWPLCTISSSLYLSLSAT